MRAINARDHTAGQIEAWAPEVPTESFWRERFPRYRVFVAEHDGEVVGFAEFEETGHIDCFYVHHARQREGIGSRMLAAIEREARAKNVELLYAEVSTTAKPFFEAQGFVVREALEKSYRGARFRLHLMSKMVAYRDKQFPITQNKEHP